MTEGPQAARSPCRMRALLPMPCSCMQDGAWEGQAGNLHLRRLPAIHSGLLA